MNESVFGIFQSLAIRLPDKIALVQTDDTGAEVKRLTYRELLEWTHIIACQLIAKGVEPGQPVALEARHTASTIAAMLAIVRIGAVYVPLDFEYPEERLEFLIQNTDAQLLLYASETCSSKVSTVIDSERIVNNSGYWDVHETDLSNIEPNELIYIMYTSGSTGKPKGVEVKQSGVVRLVDPVNTYIKFSDKTNFLQFSPLTFDVSTLEIWGPLLNGGTCVVYDFKHFPDPDIVNKVIKEQGVTSLWLTASYFNWVFDNNMLSADSGLREIISGGEALSAPHMRKAQQQLPNVQFVNGYGPTETVFGVCYLVPRPIPDDWTTIPIGYAIHKTQLYVVDANLKLVKPGEQGELLIAGEGLAKGYRHLPELTEEKFCECTFGKNKTRVYKTGDIVFAEKDNLINFIGRVDDQVKIAGHRIELGDINAQLLELVGVKEAHTQMEVNTHGDKELVAYVVVDEPTITKNFRTELAKHIPDYMIPADVIILEQMPLNQNGKVDRAALPKAFTAKIVQDKNENWQVALQNLWSEMLGTAQANDNDNFFDKGGTSLLYMRMVTRARSDLSVKLTAVDIFEAPTLGGLKKLLATRQEHAPQHINTLTKNCGTTDDVNLDIAIVGMSGRFPGAEDVDTFWQNLLAGKESITRFEFADLEPSAQQVAHENTDYVYARGVVDEHDCFDASFFGVSRLEAEISDPQQRLFLEEAWKALENAGYYPHENNRIGVFAGSGHNGYYLNNVLPKHGIEGPLGELPMQFVNDKDYLATRTAFKLNLKGPSLSINTACSTSLVTTIEAVKSLRAGECDLALAGGITLQSPMRAGYLYQEGGMLSRDGSTRPFSKDSSGTTFNSGIALVVLKRLKDALDEGDTIYSVIRGVGMNNDGAAKASFTAPSVSGQSDVVKAALNDAKCSSDDISYVETHGTATPLGDPIELEALARAFTDTAKSNKRSTPCLIGSVKSNVGHLISAAGATGLLKTALALKNGKIPATLHFKEPNPHIDFNSMPFKVCESLQQWKMQGNKPLLAGVSSFGVGGTNAHVIVSQPPVIEKQARDPRPQLITVSAKDPEVAENYMSKVGAAILKLPADQLSDAAFTSQISRSYLKYRSFTVAGLDGEEITMGPITSVKKVLDKTDGVIFMFSGQGAQTLNMGRQLYFNQPVFRDTFDECAEQFAELMGLDLHELIFSDTDNEEKTTQLAQTRYTQPALFTIEYALAQLWISLGIKPAAMIGHSIGEYTAAAVAQMFTLNDAIALVAKRGELMFSMQPGSMLAVMSDEETTRQFLTMDCEISVFNGPKATVVSGPQTALAEMSSVLEAAAIKSKLLATSHAFHSESMQQAAEEFLSFAKGITISDAKIPIISTKTGGKTTAMCSCEYWSEQIRQPVQFYQAVNSIAQDDYVLLELGPGRTLFNNSRHITSPRIASGIDGSEEEYFNWLKTLGMLWQEGIEIKWEALHQGYKPNRIPLPTYPFKRNRYWIDVPLLQPALLQNQTAGLAEFSDSMSNQNQYLTNLTIPSTEIGTVTTGNVMSTKDQLVTSLKNLFTDQSGEDFASVTSGVSFLDLGMDSLVLTQIALKLKNQYKVDIPFRRLMQDLDTFDSLSDFVVDNADAEKLPQASTSAGSSQSVEMQSSAMASPVAMPIAVDGSSIQALIAQQLHLITQQLGILGQGAEYSSAQPIPQAPSVSQSVAGSTEADNIQTQSFRKIKEAKPFGAQTRITLDKKEVIYTEEQKSQIQAVMQEYIEKTKLSKAYAQEHRSVLADPRTASGFSPEVKEIVYPIVVNRSKGSRLWDLDGNEYIDILCGFGSNLLGNTSDFIVNAMKDQLDKGIEIGPQHPLAGELAKLLADTIPLERFTFCNTGSEAVMGAIRMARTASGRNTIVMFNGAYHGIADEVIVRPGPDKKGRPAAAGIMVGATSNVMILDYGDPESLNIIRDNADDIAGVLIEPVQSRNPSLQPREFLLELRKLTEEHEIAFIMDEVITGFRVGLGGAQEYFGVKADIATYGKVIGGGISIGIIGGCRKYMDTLDGGDWQFGDDSAPEVGVTYFAGTFVRHPLALATAKAVLEYLREQGDQLQHALKEKAEDFARDMNLIFKYNNLPMEIGQFSSIMYLKFKEDVAYSDLLFADMRLNGIHIFPGRPMFFSTAHTDADIAAIKEAFVNAIDRMKSIGIFQ